MTGGWNFAMTQGSLYLGVELPKEKVVAPSGRGFQGSGQDFKLQAAQSLKFQARTLKYIENQGWAAAEGRRPALIWGRRRLPPYIFQGPSLTFQALGSLQLEILARTLKSSPRGCDHFFLGEFCPQLYHDLEVDLAQALAKK